MASTVETLLDTMKALLDEERRCLNAEDLPNLSTLAQRKERVRAMLDKVLNSSDLDRRKRHTVEGDRLCEILSLLKNKQDENARILMELLSRTSSRVGNASKARMARASYIIPPRGEPRIDRST